MVPSCTPGGSCCRWHRRNGRCFHRHDSCTNAAATSMPLGIRSVAVQAQLLVLEDDAITRQLLEDALRDEGYSVAVCADCHDVLANAEQSMPALALVDFWGESQGQLSAEEHAEIIDFASRVPTVLMSGRRWAREHQAAELGLLAIVTKPFDLGELFDLVAVYVARLCENSAEIRATSRATRAHMDGALEHLRGWCQRLSDLHKQASGRTWER